MKESKATIIGISAILLWSTTVAFARSITEELGPLTAASCIYFLGAVLSFISFYFQHKKSPLKQNFNNRYLIVCGSLFIIYMVSLYSAIGLSLDRKQLLEIGLINYLWPILTVVLSIPILKQSANYYIYLGVSIALIGIFLVTTQQSSLSIDGFIQNLLANPLAYILALSAAVTWALYSNLSRLLGANEPPGAIVLFMFATSFSLFFIRIITNESSNWNFATLLEVFYMSIVATLGYLFWDIGVRKGNFSIVSTSSYLIPFMSTLAACFYLNVNASAKLWIGCICIIVGAYISKKSLINEDVK